MKLIELSFENFRSFKQVKITNFKQINFFIGQNGVGKSNIFEGFKILQNILQDNFQSIPSYYFDKKSDTNLTFEFIIELSIDERQKILQGLINKQPGIKIDLNTEEIVKQIKFKISFKENKIITQILNVTNSLGSFQDCVTLKIIPGGNYSFTGIRLIDLFNNRFSKKPTVSPTRDISASDALVKTSKFITTFSDKIYDVVSEFFVDVSHIPNKRESMGSQKAQRVDATSLTGYDLPNELRTLSENRPTYAIYEKKINEISYGISEVSSIIENDQQTIKIREKGLTNQILHDELSSGYHQTLILTKIIQNINSNSILIEEPELHLNAKSQKQLMKLIREKSKDTQFFIETHSPIFTGANDTESTCLLSKYDGITNVIQIDKNNTNQIKLELGISHADIFDNDYLCFVEGASEYEAFLIIAKKLGYELGFEFRLWDLGGYGNIKNIKALLNYLKSSERKTFLLLDKNSEAAKLVEDLIKEDLIVDAMYHSLEKNFEDLFPSEMIIEKMKEIANDLDVKFELPVSDLENKRSSRVVDSILTEYWNKNLKDENDFPKRRLAVKMAESILDSEIANNEFAKIVKMILGKFEIELSQ